LVWDELTKIKKFSLPPHFPIPSGYQIDESPYSHIVTHIMKTTLDLSDDLLIQAKTVAAHRRTTLRALVEHALRRELRPATEEQNPDPGKYELGPFGILSLKKRRRPVSLKQMQQLIDRQHDEEDARVLARVTEKA
jgi:hypothetical protein